MAATTLLVLVVHWSLCLLICVTGDLLQRVEVPVFAFAGSRVNMSCMYDLRATGLYSLKWYHNDTEFYRHVPTETLRPVDIKPSIKFQAHEVSRSETQVTLSLTSMTSAASGEYKCEVIAEHPSFRTETRSAFMTVLDEPLEPPVIMGAREVYQVHDHLTLTCLPHQLPPSAPSPALTWYLQGRQVQEEYVSPFRDAAHDHSPGLTLRLPVSQVTRVGVVAEASCVVEVGGQELRSTTKLRVRPRTSSSYLSSYFSAAGMISRPTTQLMILSALLLLR